VPGEERQDLHGIRADACADAAAMAANRAAGAVALEVGLRAGRTRRLEVAESGSLRVRFPADATTTLEAVVINTAGGIAGGDRFVIDMTVGDDAALLATTASAEKIYRSMGDAASFAVRLRAAPRSRLLWLPRETILFDRCRLERTIDVDLADDASMVLAEAVVFGRSGMGEVVGQGHFHDRWRVRRGGRLIYAETVGLDGPIAALLDRKAVAAGGIAVATILMAPADDRFVTAVREAADAMRGEVGVSSWNGITAARFCAPDGDSLRHDLITALGFALGGPLPRLWLN
jgi:urease accessory protein